MTDTKHTPTPWVSVHRGTKKDIAKGNDYFRVGSEADVSDPDMSCTHVFGTRKEANAAHIVKCVNLHDELVEALGELIENISPHSWGSHENKMGAIKNACEALKKAGAL